MLAEGFTPEQTHLMLFISNADPLSGLTATIATTYMKILSDDCEIVNQKQNHSA